MAADVSLILLDRVQDWLTQSSLAGEDLETVVRGLCERLTAAGLPVKRVHLSFSMLHPLYDALGFTWERGGGMTVEKFRTRPGEKPERFLRSPYYYLLSNNLDHLRRRIEPAGPSEFPIFDDLKAMGVTDYIAFMNSFSRDSTQGMMGSWSTDNPTGFSDDMIASLLRIQNHLAVAAKMAVLGRLAGNMLTTYLGSGAGKRVLSGQIKRGDGETIRAALVMADMRKSTVIAERDGRQVYIDTLNQFFDAIAAPFNRSGGEILSFLGDGFLAVYPCGGQKEPTKAACQAALTAVSKAARRMKDLNRERAISGLAPIGFGVGLHVGDVMFGNVGLKDRLTFSAFGAAVNEVQRLQELTKKYRNQVIASSAFADYTGGAWTSLGDEKLRGVDEAITVLSPDFSAVSAPPEEETVFEPAQAGLSDAENVILLHRDGRVPPREPEPKKALQ
jgi:adenylate cyclase